MVQTLSKATFVFCLGTLVGLALGMVIGWKIWPVRYVSITPVDLTQAAKGDYVVMISASYAQTGDLATAKAQLNTLGYGLADVEALAGSGADRGLSLHHIRLLAQFAEALAGEAEGDLNSPTSALLPTAPTSRRGGGHPLLGGPPPSALLHVHIIPPCCHAGILAAG